MRVVATTLVLIGALATAAAAADDVSSTAKLYRSTSGSVNLQTDGFDGSGVTVAVIDSGVADVNGLDGSVIHQQNISAAPDAGDQFGHGTFVAGIVHASAPGAKIVSIKLSGANGAVDVTQVLAALQWVRAHKQQYSIDVVNLSFGNDSKQSAYVSPLNLAVQRVWDAGIVVVASSGNAGDSAGSVSKPADDPLIISVGATDEHGTDDRGDDTIPTFVGRGPTQDGLQKPDLVAPGARIVSLRAPGSTIDTQYPQARIGMDRFRGSGTSFAAPIVTGIVAQMLSADPTLTPNQVKYGLIHGATLVNGDPNAMGAGSVRARRALAVARDGSANENVVRSTGEGSLDAARGSAHVELSTVVRVADGSGEPVTVPVQGELTAEAPVTVADAPPVVVGTDPTGALGIVETIVEQTPALALDQFSAANFRDASTWDASQWGASQWGASQWGASQWGASQWGASQWGASQWGASQWWASQWG